MIHSQFSTLEQQEMEQGNLLLIYLTLRPKVAAGTAKGPAES